MLGFFCIIETYKVFKLILVHINFYVECFFSFFCIIVESMGFIKNIFLSNKVIFTAVSLNAFLIFVMEFPKNDQIFYFRVAEFLFTLFFLIEILTKSIHYGLVNYLKDDFNKLDFVVVVLSLPILISPFITLPQIGVFLMLRLLRLIRLTRLLTFVPNIGQLIAGLKRAFKASIFVLLALFLYNFILCIVTCELFRNISPTHFGNPFISFFTIFQMFTTEGWNDIVNSVVKNSNYWTAGCTRLYFMFVVLSGGIFGISIANAIFVDEMTIDNNIELEKKIDEMNHKLEHLEAFLRKEKDI